MQDFFSPTERALLFEYFEIKCPEELQEIDIRSKPDYGGIWVDQKGDKALESAVAQIALSVIQSRLPQCGIVYEDEVKLLRQPFTRPSRTVVPLPQFLFMINWADTAPGLCWPEAYHVTYIPGFERYVVTASMDSPDMWGVTELAVGSFDADTPLLVGCQNVLCDWWDGQRNMEQGRWAYVWDEGMINTATANDWADAVWSYENEEEEI